MTERNDELEIKEKIVVSLDVCSSTDILEDLLKTNRIKAWRDLLIRLKEYLEDKSKELDFELYKFTGDGWILLFDETYSGSNMIRFLSQISQRFEEEFNDKIHTILDSPPTTTGLRFGVDEGPLIQMIMRENREYIGRAINVACRLQAAISNIDIKSGYRALISHRLFSSMQNELLNYSPQHTERPLRNIVEGKYFSCYRLSISETQFKIIKATYWTENHSIDVTPEYINQITNDKLDVIVTNQIAQGDPDPGVRKNLTIEYIFNGIKQETPYKEGARIQLP